VRVDNSVGGTGKVVIESLVGLPGIDPARSKQEPQELLVLGVHADDRVAHLDELVAVFCDNLELAVSARVLVRREGLDQLAAAEAVPLEELGDHPDPDAESPDVQLLSDLGPGEVRPQDRLLVRIPGRERIDDRQERLVESRKEGHAAASATPFFRA
jgi:hypothetical protein